MIHPKDTLSGVWIENDTQADTLSEMVNRQQKAPKTNGLSLRRLGIVVSILAAAGAGFVTGRISMRGASDEKVHHGPGIEVENSRMQSLPPKMNQGPGAAATSEPLARPDLTTNESLSDENESFRPLERLRVLANFQAEKLGSILIPIIDREGSLSQGFARLFGLTESESVELQRAIDDANASIERISISNMEVAQADGSAFVITVPPFEGGV